MRKILFQPGTNIPRIKHVRRVGKHLHRSIYIPQAHFDATVPARWNELADTAMRRDPPFKAKVNEAYRRVT